MTDQEWLEDLFRRHYADLMAYAVRRCGSRAEAEDVVAETFTVALRRIGDLPEGEEARLWLFGTARLVRMNHDRSRRRQRGLLQRMRSALPASDPTRADERRPEAEAIRAALSGLREPDREVLLLQAWEGLTANEIASVLEITPAAVWKRLERARDRLAVLLDHHDATHPFTVAPTNPRSQR